MKMRRMITKQLFCHCVVIHVFGLEIFFLILHFTFKSERTGIKWYFLHVLLIIDFIRRHLAKHWKGKNRLSIEKTHYYSIEKFKSKKVTEIVLNFLHSNTSLSKLNTKRYHINTMCVSHSIVPKS